MQKAPWTFNRIKEGLRRRAIYAYRRMAKVPGKYDMFNNVHVHMIDGRTQAPVILDVGAHRGESVARFKKLYPQAAIHSFEPDSENFAALQGEFGKTPGVTLNNIGMSSMAGVKKFFRNRKSDTSGFSAVNEQSDWAQLRSKQANVTVADFTEKAYDVQIGTIDEYMARNNIAYVDILKIDTQTHEDEVLKGAQQALRENRIGAIETELIMGDAYQKSLSFLELESLIVPHGYRLYAVDRGGTMLISSSFSLNLVYVCRARMPKAKAA